MPHMVMAHDVDPAQELLDKAGSVQDIEIFNNQVLVAVYMRPNKTKSGLFLTDQTIDEDRFQSKVGLVLKVGPTAFDTDFRKKFSDITVTEHEWIVFRPSDGWSVTLGGQICRILDDTSVRGRVSHPDLIW